MKDLTVGKPGILIFKFAMPMLLGNIFQQLYQFVDSIIVGNYINKEALTAVGESWPIIFSLISFTIGIALGGTIIISQYFGAKDNKNVIKTIDTLYIFIFFTSIVITAVGLIFSDEIFKLIIVPPNVLPQAKMYFNTFILGTILFFGFNGTSAILRGLGDSITPLYFLIISTIMNVLLDLLFIVVFHWGIRGAAFATIIAQGGAFVTAIIYLNRYHKIINFSLLQFKFNTDIFKQIVKIGFPAGLQQTFVSLGMVALLWIVNKYGTDVAAAYTIGGRIDHFAIIPAMYFGQALSAFTGQNLGANKLKRVRSGLISTLGMSALISIVISIVVLLFRYKIVDMFLKEEETNVINIGIEYLVIVASSYIIFSIMFTFNGVLRGAGDTIIPMFITLLALWAVRIPFAYILSAEIGKTGIWWSVPIGWFIGSLLSSIYYSTGKWKGKGVVKYID